MSAQATVDYVAAYFSSKIENILTYDILKNLKKMIKANAFSVVKNLGGDSHNHLGLNHNIQILQAQLMKNLYAQKNEQY